MNYIYGDFPDCNSPRIPLLCDTSAMRFLWAIVYRNSSRTLRGPALLSVFVLLLAIGASHLNAQATNLRESQPATPQTTDSTAPYTLRVYTRLVQLPTLVLSPTYQPLPPIDAQKFNLALDAGPRFHPSHVRLEGDDPITLAILLDVSGDQSDLLPALSKDFSAWISSSLKPNDHVSIYAVDCALILSANYAAPNPATLQQPLDGAIHSSSAHGNKPHTTCHGSLNLRDSVAVVMQQLSKLPGRRVLLAFTDGYDGGSTLSTSVIRSIATEDAITIFGFTNSDSFVLRRENAFNWLSEMTGGLFLQSSTQDLPIALHSFIDTLRGRYILEFPTPSNMTSGNHNIQVTIDHTHAYISASGITVALPDPAITNDPNIIPTPNPDAPLLGNHRPNPNPHP
jgi:hypothetical protein